MTQRKIEYWVIPPQADAEFVAHMEQVLDLYQKPYDPKYSFSGVALLSVGKLQFCTCTIFHNMA